MTDMLPMWVVYHRPSDQPGVEYLARKWVVNGAGYKPTSSIVIAGGDKPLDRLRSLLQMRGLTCIGRKADDDPVIVEVWL